MHYKNILGGMLMVGLLLCVSASVAKDTKLHVQVNPKQAYIFADGVPIGDGTRTIKLTPGNHVIGVYNYGFKPQVREVSVEPETVTNVEFTLEPVPGEVTGPWGRIQVESASRAAVLLNGKTPEYFVGHGDEFNHGALFLPCCVQQLVVPAGTYPVTIQYRGNELWSGTVNVPANERVIINAASGTEKTASWSRGANIASLPRFKAGMASASVAVAPVTGALTASPAHLDCGESSRLNWTTTEAVDRSISSPTENMKQSEPSGELTVKPIQSTEYVLQASGPGGTIRSSTGVNVNTAVRSSLQASPGEIRYRRIGDKIVEQGSTNLSWSTSNADSVSIDPLGPVANSNNKMLTPAPTQQGQGAVNEVQNFTLTAKNQCGGTDTQTASIRIIGSIEPIPEVPLASVFFPTGQPAERSPEVGLVQSQQAVLAQAASGFKKYLEYDPDAKLTVVGNTDERDSDARNTPLSQRRADRVKQYLVSLGVPEAKIDTVAQGKDHPLDASTVKNLDEQNPNKPPEALGSFQDLVWAYNRRVDIQMAPKGIQSTQFFPATASEANFLFSSDWPEKKELMTLAAEKVALPADSSPDQPHK